MPNISEHLRKKFRNLSSKCSCQLHSAEVRLQHISEDFLLLARFVAFPWLFRGPHLLGKTVSAPFSWLFRGPHFRQILRVLALEQSRWTFRIFFIFFLLGGGKERVRGAGRGEGGNFLWKIRGGGGSSLWVGAGGERGREGVCWELGGGGAKYFFSGPKCPPSSLLNILVRGPFWRKKHILMTCGPRICS